MWRRIGWAGLCWMLCAADSPAQSRDPLVELDRERMQVRIQVSAADGRVSWNDIARGLILARGWDDEILDGLPTQTFPLDGTLAQLQLSVYNQLFAPHLQFEVARDELGKPHSLQVIADRQTILASRRRLSTWLRERLTSPLSSRRYGLKWDERWGESSLDAASWRSMPADQTAVLFVHGFQSRGSSLEPLAAAAREVGYPCGVFDYPNDQALSDSALALSKALREFRATCKQPLVLVTHSMGGLVARAVLEDPELAPAGVRRLIMIAAPHHGSNLAHFHYGLDLCEYAGNKDRREQARLISGSIEDGLCEASRDLQPGSVFLERLNRRQRNQQVQYTILLGEQGYLLEQERETMRRALQEATANRRWAEYFGGQADRWLAELDEVVVGKGDGAVAIRRGQLEGVTDVHVLPFDHLSVLRPDSSDVAPVLDLMLQRLANR